ncbi:MULTISPECIES: type II toxin-antitoxin system RelB family antitoxin [unclassified Exiguobacterium]|uniref:type II toxin-antitoxin system RelB family antitoxin n=1 Tax=unclassified Exiguobacterium TaxID=2644629 RepID=UPI00103D41F9|nr:MULTISPECIES: DUF6290 family protein [unclassified Exiguobacterium]TCI46004.1 CopG family transcriptional regulator [Exiguobacterium sp. SH5S32]TCI51761.1 CopG family transcriptional regulator [Exiguobacterium sp. SH1S4]TCI71747.1 CopG family transcriptional regulator [Exiguobacterium sp. SH1S1]TCI79806.1 CopG family transcriptional regulator [Exiguobacterium sp. SH0S1]
MGTISVRLNKEDELLIREYAKTKNLTLSMLVREAVLERIEDELDIVLYHESMSAHQEHSEAVSFEAMLKDLQT